MRTIMSRGTKPASRALPLELELREGCGARRPASEQQHVGNQRRRRVGGSPGRGAVTVEIIAPVGSRVYLSVMVGVCTVGVPTKIAHVESTLRESVLSHYCPYIATRGGVLTVCSASKNAASPAPGAIEKTNRHALAHTAQPATPLPPPSRIEVRNVARRSASSYCSLHLRGHMSCVSGDDASQALGDKGFHCASLARGRVAEVDAVLVRLQGERVDHERILLPLAEVELRERLLGRQAFPRWRGHCCTVTPLLGARLERAPPHAVGHALRATVVHILLVDVAGVCLAKNVTLKSFPIYMRPGRILSWDVSIFLTEEDKEIVLVLTNERAAGASLFRREPRSDPSLQCFTIGLHTAVIARLSCRGHAARLVVPDLPGIIR